MAQSSRVLSMTNISLAVINISAQREFHIWYAVTSQGAGSPRHTEATENQTSDLRRAKTSETQTGAGEQTEQK